MARKTANQRGGFAHGYGYEGSCMKAKAYTGVFLLCIGVPIWIIAFTLGMAWSMASLCFTAGSNALEEFIDAATSKTSDGTGVTERQ